MKREFQVAALSLAAASSLAAATPHLKHADVVRIADAKARQVMQIDLRQYERWRIYYTAEEHTWSVCYRLKANHRTVFNVRVSDDTKKADVIENGTRPI